MICSRFLLLTCFLLLMTSSLLQLARSSPQDFGIFNDPACLTSTATIDWGTISPGSTATRTVYVKNFYDTAIIDVSFSAQNFTPPLAAQYLSLITTYNSSVFPVLTGEVMSFDLTLKVSSSSQNVTDFSFGILVSVTFADAKGGSQVIPTNQPSQISLHDLFIPIFIVAFAFIVLQAGKGKGRR